MSQSVFVMDTPRDCLHCKMRSVIYDSDRGYQHCGFDTDGYKLESFFSERDLAEGWISPKCPLISEIDFINESEIQKDSWIPCSERLPENDENVLVWFEYFRFGEYNRLYQTYGISHTFRGEWSGFVNGQSGWSRLRVIAWMPLPEPYQKEGE